MNPIMAQARLTRRGIGSEFWKPVGRAGRLSSCFDLMAGETFGAV
jgi:hypothetical protein